MKCRYCPGAFKKSDLKKHRISCYQSFVEKAAEQEHVRKRRCVNVPEQNSFSQSTGLQSSIPKKNLVKARLSNPNAQQLSTSYYEGDVQKSHSPELNYDCYDDDYQACDYDNLQDGITDTSSTDLCSNGQDLSTSTSTLPIASDIDRELTKSRMFVVPLLPEMTTSEVLSLELSTIVEKYAIPRAAHSELVSHVNHSISLATAGSTYA